MLANNIPILEVAKIQIQLLFLLIQKNVLVKSLMIYSNTTIVSINHPLYDWNFSDIWIQIQLLFLLIKADAYQERIRTYSNTTIVSINRKRLKQKQQ